MNAVAYRPYHRVMSMLTRFVPVVAASLVAVFASPVFAQSYQPAAFVDTQTHVQRSVAPPELTDAVPVVALYCQADVSAQGIASAVICHEKGGNAALEAQTEAAVNGQQLTPASVDGQAVPVRMPFRVVFADREGQPPVLVLPNLGNMQNTYGFFYSDPQERLDLDPWYESYSANDWADGSMFFSNNGRLTRYIAVVNTAGEPVAVRRIGGSKKHKRDAAELEKQLHETRFIPGMADGTPQRMQHIAVLHFQ